LLTTIFFSERVLTSPGNHWLEEANRRDQIQKFEQIRDQDLVRKTGDKIHVPYLQKQELIMLYYILIFVEENMPGKLSLHNMYNKISSLSKVERYFYIQHKTNIKISLYSVPTLRTILACTVKLGYYEQLGTDQICSL